MKSLFVRVRRTALSFAILSLLAVGCKQADNVTPAPVAEPDPIPGEYKITGSTSYTIEGARSSQPISGTLSVYYANQPGSYFFVERYSTTEFGYRTTHTNGSFTVEKLPDYSIYNQVKYYGYQSGGGTVLINMIKYDRYADTNGSTYIAPTGSSYYYSKNIRKHVSVVATKQ